MSNQSFLFDNNDLGRFAKSGLFSIQFASGIHVQRFGPGVHEFSFDVKFQNMNPRNSIAHVAIANFHNEKYANNMQYQIASWSTDCSNGVVTISGKLYVGDSDGYIDALSYFCVASD